MGLATYAEDAILDALFNGAVLQKQARWVQLHTGDPGDDCSANVAAGTARKPLLDAAARGGVYESANDLIWRDVTASETYVYLSVWDVAAGGNPLLMGELTTPRSVVAGDTFVIPAGELVAALA